MKTVAQIHTRHMMALGQFALANDAVGTAMWLALTELQEQLATQVAEQAAGDIWAIFAWLDQNLDQPTQSPDLFIAVKDAVRDLQDRLAAEQAAGAALREQLASAVTSRTAVQTDVVDLRQQLAAVAAAKQGLEPGLVAAQNEAAMLRQQRANQNERIQALEAEVRDLREQLMLRQAGQQTASSEHEDVAATVASLLPTDVRDDLAHGRISFNDLTRDTRLQLVQELFAKWDGMVTDIVTFNANKPAWMPNGRSLTQSFKCRFDKLATLELPA